jgi:ABC-2 type transport system ATP-binding protein
MIKVSSIRKKISENFRISIDDLSIKDGEIVALIGTNGSGKTIFLNSVLNNILLDSGSIEIGNIDNKSNNWKKFTGVYMNENYLLDFLTPIEFLNFIGKFYNVSVKEIPGIIEKYTIFLGRDLSSLKDKRINKLSRGTKDKIGIIAASFYQPRLLIFDEPFSHLDTPSILFLLNEWEMINKQLNTTLIVSSPTINEISSICSRILLMEQGKIKYDLIQNSENLKLLRDYFATQN